MKSFGARWEGAEAAIVAWDFSHHKFIVSTDVDEERDMVANKLHHAVTQHSVWTSIVEGRPRDQRPGMVGPVSLVVSGRTRLQLMFAAPERDGGRPRGDSRRPCHAPIHGSIDRFCHHPVTNTLSNIGGL